MAARSVTGESITQGLWHPYAYVNGGGLNLEWFAASSAAGCDFDELDVLAAL